MNIMAGSLGGCFPFLSNIGLEVVSVLINNSCNLQCRHCYLQAPVSNPLTESEWLTFFETLLLRVAPSVLCFAGKEPLLGRPSVRLWSDTISLRDQIQKGGGRRTAIGLITNGTLILRHYDTLLSTPPDYIDVSIDGLPETHDAIRGMGAFKALEGGLQWLVRELPDRVWITHTLLGPYLEQLPRFVEYLHLNYGINRFSLGSYRDFPYTDHDLMLDPFISRLPHAIERLGRVSVQGAIQIVMEVGPDQISEARALRRLGWSPSRHPFSSDVLVLPNGIHLRINYSAIPTGLWRSVRVSSEGHWIAAEDLAEPLAYGERSVMNLRDCRFDAQRAYEVGLRHPRLEALLAQARDGVSVSENIKIRQRDPTAAILA